MPPTLEAVEQHHRSKAATGGAGASRPTSFSGGAPAPLAGRRTQTDPSRPTSFSAGKKAAGYTPSSASEEKAEASGKGAIVANLQAHKNKMGKEYSEKDDDDVYELVREMLESERPPRAWYIVMPDTRLKMMWDLLILLLVFVSAFSIPAGISYAAIMGPGASAVVVKAGGEGRGDRRRRSRITGEEPGEGRVEVVEGQEVRPPPSCAGM